MTGGKPRQTLALPGAGHPPNKTRANRAAWQRVHGQRDSVQAAQLATPTCFLWPDDKEFRQVVARFLSGPDVLVPFVVTRILQEEEQRDLLSNPRVAASRGASSKGRLTLTPALGSGPGPGALPVWLRAASSHRAAFLPIQPSPHAPVETQPSPGRALPGGLSLRVGAWREHSCPLSCFWSLCPERHP